MIPELGHFALILSLLVALSLGDFGVAGGHRNRADWMAFARQGAQVLWLLTAISFACLTSPFIPTIFLCNTWHNSPTPS